MKTRFSLVALLLLFFVAPLTAQIVLDKELVIKPIFVQNGPGGTIAVQDNFGSSFALYMAATQRVYAQAGIRIVWEPSAIFVSSTFYTVLDGTTASNLVAAPNNGSSVNASTLNLFFTGPSGNGTAGISNQSTNLQQGFVPPLFVNGSTVSETAFQVGSLTTIPHEIGHVLGLDHSVIGPGPGYAQTYTQTLASGGNLMAQGTGATSLNQITGDQVNGFGILTANQIALLRLNPLVQNNPVANDTYSYSAVPEPSTYALVAGALMGLFAVGRRWKSKAAKNAATVALV